MREWVRVVGNEENIGSWVCLLVIMVDSKVCFLMEYKNLNLGVCRCR